MSESEMVPASHVLLGCEATTVDETLRFLSEQAVAFGIAEDADAVCEAFRTREEQGTTGMMGGFAIPHAKSDALARSAVFVVRFSEGVAWPSMDDVPVTCAIALLTPASEAGAGHLQLLSRVAVMLMDGDVRARILAAEGPADIAAAVSAGLAAAR